MALKKMFSFWKPFKEGKVRLNSISKASFLKKSLQEIMDLPDETSVKIIMLENEKLNEKYADFTVLFEVMPDDVKQSNSSDEPTPF